MSTSEMSTKRHWKRNYFTILIGQTFSQVTSGALQMAIVFYLTLKTGSSMVLSMATMMGFLPQAVLGPFIGTLIDRHSRKKIMITSDLVIAGAAVYLSFYCNISRASCLDDYASSSYKKYRNSIPHTSFWCDNSYDCS